MWSANVFQIDLRLRPVVAEHLGDGIDFELGQYSNKLIALKFVEFFQAGSDKFQYPAEREERERLANMNVAFQRAMDEYYALSKSTRIAWEAEFNAQQLTQKLLKTGANELLLLGEEDSEKFLNDDDQSSIGTNGRWTLWSLQSATENIQRRVAEEGVNSKVDWKACATAHLARVAWEKRLGKVAPISAHADAPGPFGRFLQDVLDVLYNGFWHDEPPSARSALRALENITRAGAKPTGNW